MEYSIDYLLIAFWLIVFAAVFGICGIAETISENELHSRLRNERRNNGRLKRNIHRRLSYEIRRGYDTCLQYAPTETKRPGVAAMYGNRIA